MNNCRLIVESWTYQEKEYSRIYFVDTEKGERFELSIRLGDNDKKKYGYILNRIKELTKKGENTQ